MSLPQTSASEAYSACSTGSALPLSDSGASCDSDNLSATSVPKNIPQLQLSEFRELKKIASGGFSKVYRALHVPSSADVNNSKSEYVALKVLNLGGIEMHQNQSVMAELQLQYKLRSPYVVRCRGTLTNSPTAFNAEVNAISDGLVSEFENKFVIVMEYCEGGSLKELLTHPEYRTLSREARVWFAQQVSRAVLALSIENVVHGDLKALNFVWGVEAQDTRPSVKVSDFGNSKLHETARSLSVTPGTFNIDELISIF